MLEGVVSQSISYGNDALNFINDNTGINLKQVASNTITKAADLKARAAKTSLPTFTEFDKAVEGITGVNSAKVVKKISEATTSVKNFVTENVKDLNLHERLSDISKVAVEHLMVAKENFEKFHATPSLENGLKIAPWVVGGLVVTAGIYYVMSQPGKTEQV